MIHRPLAWKRGALCTHPSLFDFATLAVAACLFCNANWDEQARDIFLSFWNSLIGSTEKIKMTQEDRDSCFKGAFQMWEQREVKI